MIRPTFLISLILALTSCASQYDIAGRSTLDEVDGHMLYLCIAGDSVEHYICSIDSCQVEHGRFRFSGVVDSVVLAQVCIGKEMMLPIVLENGQLQMSINAVEQTVQGGQLNKRLYTFLQKRNRLENQLWQAEQECIRSMRMGNCSIKEAQERLRKRASRLNRQIEEAETQFVEDNYSNALGPGYFIMLCNQQIFPTMTEQLRQIVNNAPDAFFQNPYIINYLRMAGYDINQRLPLHRVKR